MNAVSGIASLTPLQLDLLRATCAADDTAPAAWRRWRDAIDWDAHLDHDTFRLLPLTCRNLRRQGVTDPLFPRIDGIARQAWYGNQHRLRRFHPTMRALAAAGVEPLIVPPTALLVLAAATVFDRSAPFVCAVRGEHAEVAIHCLSGEGWRTWIRLPRWSLAGYVMAADHVRWHDNAGQTLDLLWQWDANDSGGRFPGDVWARARPGRLANEPVLMHDATDAVHDLCLQPIAANPFGQIVTLLLLLAVVTPPLDWRHFALRVAQAPVAPAWRDILAMWQAHFPEIILASLIADWPTPAMPTDATPPAPSRTVRDRMAIHWSTYRHAWGARYSFPAALRHLPGYLLARWNLPAMHRLPPRLWRGFRHEWRDAHRSR